jgi:hypothetical protein
MAAPHTQRVQSGTGPDLKLCPQRTDDRAVAVSCPAVKARSQTAAAVLVLQRHFVIIGAHAGDVGSVIGERGLGPFVSTSTSAASGRCPVPAR